MNGPDLDETNYQNFAESLKEQGNQAFQANDYELAIRLYSQAIEIDPDNHVLYSNRSAAYLKADSKSNALYDAEKCVTLAPVWAKGYSRLGTAQQSLKRFELAIESFKKGIEIDPNNQILWSSLRSCQEAYENDKKQRFAAAEIERAFEEERQRKLDEQLAAMKNSKPKEEDLLSEFFSDVKELAPTTNAFVGHAEPQIKQENVIHQEKQIDDELAGFFADVGGSAESQSNGIMDSLNSRDESSLTEKYVNQDLGDGETQMDIDATEEDIRYRYKKLSTKVHPDKMRDMENAREAFEQVKEAYQKLTDPDQKKVIVAHIEKVKEEYLKERRKLISKGLKESDLPPLEEELNKKIMVHFAEMEMSKRRSETNLRAYSARDKMAEEEMKEKLETERNFEKEWSEETRRDKRVGNWRDFQSVPESKKSRISSYKEENTKDTKKVVIEKESWKKNWK